MKNYYFTDPDTVEKFLWKKFTHPNCGLSVDIVSFFSFLVDNPYINNNSIYQNTHFPQKIGFASICDTGFSFSFQNVLTGDFFYNPDGNRASLEVDLIDQL